MIRMPLVKHIISSQALASTKPVKINFAKIGTVPRA